MSDHSHFKSPKILVLGAGGLGTSHMYHLLTSYNININNENDKNLLTLPLSNVTVIDNDTIELTNISRQQIYKREHINLIKVDVMRGFCFKRYVTEYIKGMNIKSDLFIIGEKIEKIMKKEVLIFLEKNYCNKYNENCRETKEFFSLPSILDFLKNDKITKNFDINNLELSIKKYTDQIYKYIETLLDIIYYNTITSSNKKSIINKLSKHEIFEFIKIEKIFSSFIINIKNQDIKKLNLEELEKFDVFISCLDSFKVRIWVFEMLGNIYNSTVKNSKLSQNKNILIFDMGSGGFMAQSRVYLFSPKLPNKLKNMPYLENIESIKDLDSEFYDLFLSKLPIFLNNYCCIIRNRETKSVPICSIRGEPRDFHDCMVYGKERGNKIIENEENFKKNCDRKLFLEKIVLELKNEWDSFKKIKKLEQIELENILFEQLVQIGSKNSSLPVNKLDGNDINIIKKIILQIEKFIICNKEITRFYYILSLIKYLYFIKVVNKNDKANSNVVSYFESLTFFKNIVSTLSITNNIITYCNVIEMIKLSVFDVDYFEKLEILSNDIYEIVRFWEVWEYLKISIETIKLVSYEKNIDIDIDIDIDINNIKDRGININNIKEKNRNFFNSFNFLDTSNFNKKFLSNNDEKNLSKNDEKEFESLIFEVNNIKKPINHSEYTLEEIKKVLLSNINTLKFLTLHIDGISKKYNIRSMYVYKDGMSKFEEPFKNRCDICSVKKIFIKFGDSFKYKDHNTVCSDVSDGIIRINIDIKECLLDILDSKKILSVTNNNTELEISNDNIVLIANSVYFVTFIDYNNLTSIVKLIAVYKKELDDFIVESSYF